MFSSANLGFEAKLWLAAVAANYRSACRSKSKASKSKADFISKLGTVEEEGLGKPRRHPPRPHLVAELHAQFAESAKLEAAIRANLNQLNYQP